jgi:DNA-directed RNA polymerase delta subunit
MVDGKELQLAQLVEMMADGRVVKLGEMKVGLTDWMMVDDLVE